MRRKIKKIITFIQKDFTVDSSYRLAFLLGLAGVIMPIINMFFVSHIVDSDSLSNSSESYTDYFSFVIIGLSFSGYFQFAISTFSRNIRQLQTTGCLEALLTSQTSPVSIVLLSSIYSFISSGIGLIVTYISAIVLGFDISSISIFSTVVVFILSMIMYISIGVISAGFIIMFKKGNPVELVFGTLSQIFGGVFFPVAIMPKWLQGVSDFIPIKYTLDALRLTIIKGYSIDMITKEVLTLLCIVVVLFPFSLFFISRTIHKGRKNGSIAHF